MPESGAWEDFSSQPDTVTHSAAFISIFSCSCFLTCWIYAIENKGRDDGVSVIKGQKTICFFFFWLFGRGASLIPLLRNGNAAFFK